MPRLVGAKCPNCGAGVQVDPSLESFTCSYCNTSAYIETPARRQSPDHPPSNVPVIRVDAVVTKFVTKLMWFIAICTLLPLVFSGVMCVAVPMLATTFSSTVTQVVTESASRGVETRRGTINSGGLDYFADATSLPGVFAAKVGTPLMAMQLVIYRTYSNLKAQDPKNPSHVDRYALRMGGVGEPEPERLSGKEKEKLDPFLFDLQKIDFSLIPKLIADAKTQLAYDGAEASHIILERGLPFSPGIVWRVYVTSARDSGRVEYDPSGQRTKIYK